VIFTYIEFLLRDFVVVLVRRCVGHRIGAALFCFSISVRCFVQFRLKDYIWLGAYSIDDFGVVNVVDSKT
jgi:hypothetical protein